MQGLQRIGTLARDREALIHFHPMGFNGGQVGLRNHVAVYIRLCTADIADNQQDR